MGESYGTFEGLSTQTVKTLEEAIRVYGLDRKVEKRELYFPDMKGHPTLSPYHCQMVDVETDYPLGVVGVNYVDVPFPVAFAPAEPLIDNGAVILGGGAPGHGETGYLLMEQPGAFKVGKHEIRNRFLFRSGHTGQNKIEVRCTPYFTANRVALTVDAARPLAFKHTRNVESRVTRAKVAFRTVNENWNSFTSAVQKMVAVNITDKEAEAFIEQVMPSKSDGTRIKNIREDILTLFKHTGRARTIPQCRGTVFGLVQAVGEWADFHRTMRSSKRRDDVSAGLDARLVSDAAKKKQKGWALALTMMKSKKMAGATLTGL